MINRALPHLLFLFISVLFLMGTPVFADQEKININTAGAEELCGLKRIGMTYAKRIVQYRKEKGEFQSPEEIMKVRGIGRKTFAANQNMIIVREEIAAVSKSD